MVADGLFHQVAKGSDSIPVAVMGDYLSSRGDISAKTIESMVFDMDSNGDGHIDLHEWRRAWKTFGKDRSAEEEVEQPLAAPRTRVTFAREIDEPTTAPNAAGVAGAEALRKALLSQVLRVIDLFRKLDANNDGKVSSAEFRRVLPLLATAGVLNAASFAEADVDSLFALLDLDGSGSIEYSELHKRLRQGLSVTLDQKLQAGAKWAAGSEGDQLDHLLAAAAALKTPTWQQAWQQAAETTQRVKASARPERDVRAPILPAALRLDKGRSSNPAYWDKDHIERTLVQPWGGPPSDHYN